MQRIMSGAREQRRSTGEGTPLVHNRVVAGGQATNFTFARPRAHDAQGHVHTCRKHVPRRASLRLSNHALAVFEHQPVQWIEVTRT